MQRILVALLSAVLCLSAQTPKKNAAKPGFDKQKFEQYVRHLNLWPAEITVEVRDPKPSEELAGFQWVEVKASLGERFTEQRFLVNKEQTRVIQGEVLDLTANPFQKQIGVINNAGSPALGTAGAPVVVALFTDFQCPYCKQEADVIRKNLIQTFPKEVRLYFHDFPLEQIHPWARTAAIAGRCAHLQGDEGFWKFHDWAFAQQQQLKPETFRSQLMAWAPQNGLDILQLTRCFDNKETEELVNKDLAMGRELKLNSTPTLFVNGRKLAGSVDWESLKRVIEMELKYQETAKNAGDTACCSVSLTTPGAK
ncbi:MAG: DsbA family protein [Bryobacter sp.]|nr:DsbA family protein [Bryobacter sp.]